MRQRPQIVAAVLAAFVTTTAIPGRQVIRHSHAGGDHEHAHDSLEHEALAHHAHDDDHHHGHHHAHDHDQGHDGGLTAADRDPLAHTHVASPFHPATPAALPAVRTAPAAARAPAARPSAPPARATGPARSRAPPPSARV